jgi:hypothetical protein
MARDETLPPLRRTQETSGLHKPVSGALSIPVAGLKVGRNCGDAACQTIDHAHIHLIPRRMGDMDNPEGGSGASSPRCRATEAGMRNHQTTVNCSKSCSSGCRSLLSRAFIIF